MPNNHDSDKPDIDTDYHALKRQVTRLSDMLSNIERRYDQTQHLLSTRINELEETRGHLRQKASELEESETRFKQLADAAFEGVIIIEDGIIIDSNQAAASMYGEESIDRLIGMEMLDLIDDDYKSRAIDHMHRVSKKKYDARHVRCDGRKFPVEIQEREIKLQDKTYQVLAIRDVTQQKQVEMQLQDLANTDPLTGINNRRHFFQLADKELARTVRYQSDLSILMLDIDNFKSINDNFGHSIGDQVIKSAADTLTSLLRENDIVGRLGGEEFAALLPGTAIRPGHDAAERIRKTVSETAIPVAGKQIRFTVSIGVAQYKSEDDNIDSIINRADSALYEAKKSGRNQVKMWENRDQEPL